MEVFIGTVVMLPWNWAPMGFQLCWGQNLPVNQYQAVYALLGLTFGGSLNNNFNLPDLRGRVPVGQGQGPGLSPYTLGQRAGAETTSLNGAQLPAHVHGATFSPVMGTASVTIPGTSGSLSATGAMAVDTAVGTVSALPAGSTNGHLAGLAGSVKVGSSTNPVTMQGPYTTGTPASTASVPVSVGLTGSAGTPATTVSIPSVTGGAVSIGVAGSSAPFDNRQPLLTLNFVIALEGLWPPRP
jgi:microcystin-dependent protein